MSENFKILIAYDGSSFADAAIDDLTNAGLPEKAEALVLSVAEVWLPPHKEGEKLEFVTESLQKKFEESVEEVNEAKNSAKRAAEGLRGKFPEWNVSSEGTFGSPAWEILSRAEDFKADLIIVGAQGVHGLEAIFLGSVAQKIVTEASCSVRVARGKVDLNGSAPRIILGYDGSAGANATVEALASRNWRPGTEVKVLIVEDTALIRRSFEIEDEQIDAIGNSVVEKLSAAGLNATLDVREGNPKEIVVEESEKWSADCIFIGATQFNDIITKYLLGSVSSAIVTRAPCSVEVVRAKAPTT
jgi:nucleotide-binding universal stress UspA family protein